MLTFDELRARYDKTPRAMDAYLRPLTRIETGPPLPFPYLKLTLATILMYGGSYYGASALDINVPITLFVVLPFWLGVCIQIVRAASATERTARLLCSGPVVTGKVVRAHNRLYQQGVERALATVVFTTEEDKRDDELFLRDVVRRVRSATEAKSPAAEMAEAANMVKNNTGLPIRLPESIADNGQTWLGVVEINPERLADNKIVNQQVLLIVAPEGGLVAQL